jgi:membrane protein
VALAPVKSAMGAAYRDVIRHHTFQVAAALSYYFVLAIFPALIFLSATMASIPLPGLFEHVIYGMVQLLPADTMRLLQSVLLSVLSSNRTAWIPASIIAVIWITSAAFDALIEALDIAYDVDDPRPFWKTRLLAIGLSAASGALLIVVLSLMILGPKFAEWLAARIALSRAFILAWPFLHWTIVVSFTVLAVELIYYFAPNVKQRFLATLPGALLTVVCWLLLSGLLGIYLRHFADYNAIYGTLGGFVAFMTWLYWNSFVLMLGAELNAEIAKANGNRLNAPRRFPGPLDRAA